jgi:hypothetical protein
MQTKIPHLTYLPKTDSGRFSPCINVNGGDTYHIEDLGKFHKALGYTQDLAKAGILPDEFIWEEYFRYTDVNRAVCFQVHLIEYLLKHSASFRKMYGEKCESWIADHAKSPEQRIAQDVAQAKEAT